MSAPPIRRVWDHPASARFRRSGPVLPRYESSWPSVFDERCQNTHAVIKRAGLGVEVLGQPIDRRAAIGIGLRIDRFDQFAANAGAAYLWVGIEILKVTDLLKPPVVRVIDVVDKAYGASVLHRQKAALIGMIIRA